MRIGILGAGGMAAAATLTAAAPPVRRSLSPADGSSSPGSSSPGSSSPGSSPYGPPSGGVRTGTWEDVARFGDVVVVAVLEEAVDQVVRAAGPALRGKPLIDVTNAVGPGAYDVTRSVAERIAALTGGHVVKAFNLCHVDVWRMTPPVFDGRPLAVPLCGDDEHALTLTRALVSDLGCTPVHGGGLGRAKLLEATAAFMIGLWIGGADAQAVLPPLLHSGAHPAS
ncbi:NADPH-dependent F420 reductase [Nonomuraea sp. SBT364]|uniref:NADPH-dependent F420 reductase n=1 Tax=Nonomuraea sp. SBT364 TaxID=1580530 RepID=UPI00066B4DED|nr:NAD(P)-binding domain-containing protein [Nonomuraea sp. SBT364]